ncbi:hypothetical protein T484DRAFT_1802693, partial [Baffinella frigidus]
ARHAGAVSTLVDLLKSHLRTGLPDESNLTLVKFVVVAIRRLRTGLPDESNLTLVKFVVVAIWNICVDNWELQEELYRCNGIPPLMDLLWSCAGVSTEVLELVISTLYHVSTLSENVQSAIRCAVRYSRGSLPMLLQDQGLQQGARDMLANLAKFSFCFSSDLANMHSPLSGEGVEIDPQEDQGLQQGAREMLANVAKFVDRTDI